MVQGSVKDGRRTSPGMRMRFLTWDLEERCMHCYPTAGAILCRLNKTPLKPHAKKLSASAESFCIGLRFFVAPADRLTYRSDRLRPILAWRGACSVEQASLLAWRL